MNKHGLSKHPLHSLWRNIKDRCYNPNNRCYKIYGGRGIFVCEEWKNDAAAFIKWALANGYKKGLTIDRTNNELGYAPENCRFVNMKVQASNTRKNLKFETKTVMEWCRILSLKPPSVYARIKRGIPIEDSIKIPMKINGSWQKERIILKDSKGRFCKENKSKKENE